MRHILMAIVVMALLVVPISMLRGADAPAPNAPAPIATKPATQPTRAIGLLDFKGRDQMTQVAQSMKMILLGCCMYANDHAGVFPADQGELVPLLLGNTHADGRATLFVDPRSPVDLPKEPLRRLGFDQEFTVDLHRRRRHAARICSRLRTTARPS